MKYGQFEVQLVQPTDEIWSVDDEGLCVAFSYSSILGKPKYRIVNSEGETLVEGRDLAGVKRYAEALAAGLSS